MSTSDPASVNVKDRELLVEGRIFDVVRERIELPSGLEQDLILIEHKGAVCIAPVTEEGELLLVRQYRHAVREWTLELPAGRLEPGEAPETAARRELEEETGYRAQRWAEVRRFVPAPGFCSEELVLFSARGLEEVPGGGLACDDDEEIELVRATPAELLNGASRDAKTLIAASLLSLNRL